MFCLHLLNLQVISKLRTLHLDICLIELLLGPFDLRVFLPQLVLEAAQGDGVGLGAQDGVALEVLESGLLGEGDEGADLVVYQGDLGVEVWVQDAVVLGGQEVCGVEVAFEADYFEVEDLLEFGFVANVAFDTFLQIINLKVFL